MCKGVLKFVFNSNPSLWVLAMSASFCVEEQSKFSSIMPVQPTNVCWGPAMAPHGITFDVSVLGIVAGSMANEIVFYLKHNLTYKVILYTNTKSSAEGHLLVLVKKALASKLVNGDAIPLTGDSGLMMKNWLILVFSGAIQSSVSNFCILLATSTTNCGISSTYSLLEVCYGFPPMLFDLLHQILQERGCAYHQSQVLGDFSGLTLFVSQLELVYIASVAYQERAIGQGALHPIEGPDGCSSVSFCTNAMLSHHLGRIHRRTKCPPNSRALSYQMHYCCGEQTDATTTFWHSFLVLFLSTKVFLLGPVPVTKLIKCLGDNKSKVFTTPGYNLAFVELVIRSEACWRYILDSIL
jgi:hypothetical protein